MIDMDEHDVTTNLEMNFQEPKSQRDDVPREPSCSDVLALEAT